MFMYLMFKPTSGGGRTRNFYAEHFALVYKNLLIWTVYTIINGRHSFDDTNVVPQYVSLKEATCISLS